MKKLLKFSFLLTLSLILLGGLKTNVSATESSSLSDETTTTTDTNSFDVAAEHAIAIEVSTGKILYEKDAQTVAGIASITKIITAYLVYEAVAEGKTTWDSNVDISDYPYALTVNSEASNVPMEARSYTVKQLLEAALIASANSAAIALAEHIAGSEPEFVDMMKEKLEEWGITDAQLVNASGLNNSMLGENIYPGSSSTDENMMSAEDVAIIAKHLIEDYPEVLEITSQTTADFDGTAMTTYNYMLESYPYYREGVDGLKTGTTELAGASFVATSTENGMRVITVVLHADNADEDTYARFEATYKLLDYIVNRYQLVEVVKQGESYNNSTAYILNGKSESVDSVAENTMNVVIDKTVTESADVTYTTNNEGYQATVNQGDQVGTLTYNDQSLIGEGYLDGALPSVKMVSSETVERSIFLKVWWNEFVNWVNSSL